MIQQLNTYLDLLPTTQLLLRLKSNPQNAISFTTEMFTPVLFTSSPKYTFPFIISLKEKQRALATNQQNNKYSYLIILFQTYRGV